MSTEAEIAVSISKKYYDVNRIREDFQPCTGINHCYAKEYSEKTFFAAAIAIEIAGKIAVELRFRTDPCPSFES